MYYDVCKSLLTYRNPKIQSVCIVDEPFYSSSSPSTDRHDCKHFSVLYLRNPVVLTPSILNCALVIKIKADETIILFEILQLPFYSKHNTQFHTDITRNSWFYFHFQFMRQFLSQMRNLHPVQNKWLANIFNSFY